MKIFDKMKSEMSWGEGAWPLWPPLKAVPARHAQ